MSAAIPSVDSRRREDGSAAPWTMRVTIPTLAIALLVMCSVTYLAGEIFRLQRPDHPLTRFAASLELGPEAAPVRRKASGRGGAAEEMPRAATPASPSAHAVHHQMLEDHSAEKSMPRPKLQRGKPMPEAKYTSGSEVSDVDAVRSSYHLHIEEADDDDEGGSTAAQSGDECTANASAAALQADSAGGDDEDDHLPAGQHLLVDIKGVDGNFLNSEERLAQAILDVVNESHLTLLSYHCHALVPAGVSCVGVLLESHISFHTWPIEGVISLDLFTCGSNPLLPVVKVIEKLFAIPQPGAGTYQPLGAKNASYAPQEEDYIAPPHMLWSHVLRGFRNPLENGRRRVLELDVADIVLSKLDLDYKEEIANVQTDFQHISIYDVVDPRFASALGYERSVRPELGHTYEGRHPELFQPDRKVFLDGVVQSSRKGDQAYHEALVHPGMFAHPNPKRAAIIGGGEGATLREILKHNTVEHVKMIEIDEMMVNVSKEYLSDWNTCSDLVGSAAGCFDDPRAELLYEDALTWFIDRFAYPECECGEGSGLSKAERSYCECDSGDSEDDSSDDGEEDAKSSDNQGEEEKFDVIIMDALDPQDSVEFAEVLYKNEVFLESLYGALSDQGVLVMQLGMSPGSDDPAEEDGLNENRATVMSMIQDVGFSSMHIYEEGHCGFQYPWSFLVACKSYYCRNHWYADEALVMTEIHGRIARTKSGAPALSYFDGATMGSYQVPSKAWETVFCRRDPQPVECSLYRGLNPKTPNFEADNFEVTTSSLGENAGRGTFTKVDLPTGGLIMQEQAQKKVHFSPMSTELIHDYYENSEMAEDLGDLVRYMEGYGYEQKTVAAFEYYVDSGFLTFVNHGCNGTSNVGDHERDLGHYQKKYLNEALVDPANDQVPEVFSSTKNAASATFSPVHDRHLPNVAAGYEYVLRDIKAGEELFSNYLFYCASEDGWRKEVRSLQEQCRGESLGQVKVDENEWDEEEDE